MEYRCVLSKGLWYEYNEDYISYLHESLAEIDVEYHPEYDYSIDCWKRYIERMVAEEGRDEKYRGLSEDELRKKIEHKYYAERAFNNWRQENNGFTNYDRETQNVDGMDIEIMDLYCDEAIYAVKKGSSSGKLCYVVDQSLSSLKMYKHGQLEFPPFKTVVIWLILERNHHLPENNGKPDINDLNMLSLKNRLDQWKKKLDCKA